MYYDKIIEIIVFLLRELQNNKQLSEVDLDALSKLGYTQNEINTAFGWLYSKMFSGEKVFTTDKSTHQSHRVLHDVERNIILPDAHGYLIQLRELGLLSDMDIEVIIDKIMVSGFTNVGVDEIKAFIASYLLDIEDMTNTNRRVMLNTNDTIN
ncbi:MAG: DUF494 family protein [Ignavibacteriae bacterium]|nr:MAG: DUF494 family protein [Ignavibacteriota bacterium]